MGLNKAKGQMYPFLNDYPTPNVNRGYTWNPVGGECLHKCSYCFVKKGRTMNLKKYQGEARIDEKCMKDNLGSGNYIFVGSATDIFGEWVSDEIIKRILDYCKRFDNQYLFQSKNPKRFKLFNECFPKLTILGTTIETNIFYNINNAPSSMDRAYWLEVMHDLGYKVFVSIEPIMDFHTGIFIEMIRNIKPEFVSIGADSKKSGLNEPPAEKIRELINELEKFTEVKIKNNLSRLIE